MIHNNIEITATPEVAGTEELLKKEVARQLEINKDEINGIRIIRKSIDARSRQGVKINLCADVYTNESEPQPVEYPFHYKDVTHARPVIVVGSGPAGLFASLRLIEHGLKPILLERGKSVSERKIDIAQLDRNNGLNPESNYCFGEGGAGTFSDGKLFSRSKKRGNSMRILQNFHLHGASDEILYEAHPHIGTDKLPQIIKKMREDIEQYGGEVHFETKVIELKIKEGHICGVKTNNGNDYDAQAVILATGHSARDVYKMLDTQGIKLEAKGFAMGVRVEHQQTQIDRIQYHLKEKGMADRGAFLPPASYNQVTQVEGRGVYSFCMCPGGFIVPASTFENECVVNGMSPSKRNSPYANSGIVVEIRPEDINEDYQKYGAIAGLKFQEQLELTSFQNGGGRSIAPAQRLQDFVKGKPTNDLPKTSYVPGIIPSALHFWLPQQIGHRLQEGFKYFNNKMSGYVTNDAIVVGVESRTSSPVRIPRDPETLEHVEVKGLYPCGEGAGYAGGITSSAVDGENCADKIAEWLK